MVREFQGGPDSRGDDHPKQEVPQRKEGSSRSSRPPNRQRSPGAKRTGGAKAPSASSGRTADTSSGEARPAPVDRPGREGVRERFSRPDRPAGTARRSKPKPRAEERGLRPIREDLVTQACLEVYSAIRHDGRLADRALEYALRKKSNLYSNERRAVAERIYALLRRQITVDHLLETARPSLVGVNTTAKDLLRLSASRVLMGEDPVAVARSLLLTHEDAQTLQSLPAAAAAIEALPREQRFPIAASLPAFIAEKFRAEFGDDAEVAVEAMNERAPLTARVNTLKTDREGLIQRLRDEGVECRPTPLSPLGVLMETRINAFSLETFKEGFFELQDEGSQLLGMLVDPMPTRVVDACAGAGGKTLQLAAEMGNRGELFALDVAEGRLEDLRKRARRAGVHNVRVRAIAPEEPQALEQLHDLVEKADRVMVDAPCSGTGTFRRKPDARYRLSPEALEEHIARQKRLLSQFAALVKPGGRLIYGTCSVLRAENEDVVEDFLARHPDFQVKPVADELGPELGAQVSREGFLRLWPHLHGTDGFFGAILIRAKK